MGNFIEAEFHQYPTSTAASLPPPGIPAEAKAVMKSTCMLGGSTAFSYELWSNPHRVAAVRLCSQHRLCSLDMPCNKHALVENSGARKRANREKEALVINYYETRGRLFRVLEASVACWLHNRSLDERIIVVGDYLHLSCFVLSGGQGRHTLYIKYNYYSRPCWQQRGWCNWRTVQVERIEIPK